MKKIFISVSRDEFWQRYWSAVREDVNELKNANEYPLHLIDKYIDREKKIIELGCGLGRVLKHYHYRGYDIEGIEYDRYCVSKLKSEDGNLKIRQANITSLPYNNKAFDVATAFGILGHLENDMGKAFLEVNRILREGGLLAGSLCYDNLGRVIFRLIHFLKRIMKGKERHFYTYLFTKDEIVQTLERYGFEVLEMQPVLSREVLHENFFFLRGKRCQASLTLRRSGEEYFRLNWFGELAYGIIKRFFPDQYTFAISFVARKVKDVN